jgi:hypothetical protein
LSHASKPFFALVSLEIEFSFCPGLPGPWPPYFMFSTIAGKTYMYHYTHLILPSSSDYRREPLMPGWLCFLRGPVAFFIYRFPTVNEQQGNS